MLAWPIRLDAWLGARARCCFELRELRPVAGRAALPFCPTSPAACTASPPIPAPGRPSLPARCSPRLRTTERSAAAWRSRGCGSSPRPRGLSTCPWCSRWAGHGWLLWLLSPLYVHAQKGSRAGTQARLRAPTCCPCAPAPAQPALLPLPAAPVPLPFPPAPSLLFTTTPPCDSPPAFPATGGGRRGI